MKKKLSILLIVLLISLISCSTTTPTAILFSDFVSPPDRPTLDNITGEDCFTQIKQLSENLIKAITAIERWEVYQDSQDLYYIELFGR